MLTRVGEARARKARRMKAMLLGVTLAVGVLALAVVPFSSPAGAETRWQPAPGTSWQWQLSSRPETLLDVDAYDLDGFDTPKATVDRIHATGGKAICYISVGSWENWRPDRGRFPKRVLGRDYYGWPGEKWLDIRDLDALAPIMGARMDVCKQKGFDAVEPDNMDGYQNRTGFKISYAQQFRYNEFLADAAHERGLAIAMKNDPDQVTDLVDHFDFAITEDCFAQNWCHEMSPFVDGNKAVLAAEYTDTGARLSRFCPKAQSLGFDAILKKRNLGAWRRSC
jgi:hypothetical protein